jgi:hypothetical protein
MDAGTLVATAHGPVGELAVNQTPLDSGEVLMGAQRISAAQLVETGSSATHESPRGHPVGALAEPVAA